MEPALPRGGPCPWAPEMPDLGSSNTSSGIAPDLSLLRLPPIVLSLIHGLQQAKIIILVCLLAVTPFTTHFLVGRHCCIIHTTRSSSRPLENMVNYFSANQTPFKVP